MRRLAILAVVLTTTAAPLAALCGLDCGGRTGVAVRAAVADADCPLHEQPAPAEHHHSCDHDHHVAPATAKDDSAAARRDTAVDVFLERPTHVIVSLGKPGSIPGLSSLARRPQQLFVLRI
jgi:hypothetical protein